MASMKLQATLTGFAAWSLAKLAARKGKTQAEIASYVIELWVDANSKYLGDHGITYDQFELETGRGNVVQIDRSKGG
jgi:hypothetical protein